MPKGVYIHKPLTKESKNKLQSWNRTVAYRKKVALSMINNKNALGHKVTKDVKRRIRAKLIGIPKKPRTLEHRKNLSIALSGRKLSELHIKKNSESHKGYKASIETKKKMGISQAGRKHTEETKKKMRISAINYINKIRGNISPNIGINENSLLNHQEKLDNCKIQRNYHIKDLGYFVDGYCPETNTVYEVYEKFHNEQVQKDLERETEICNYLSCDFIILYDGTH